MEGFFASDRLPSKAPWTRIAALVGHPRQNPKEVTPSRDTLVPEGILPGFQIERADPEIRQLGDNYDRQGLDESQRQGGKR
jgi:hypothetical protein